MQNHSRDLEAAVQGSHHAPIQVDVIRDGKVFMHLDDVIAGEVTSDGSAAQRTTIKVDVPVDLAGTLIPDDMSSPLAPSGDRLQVYRGVRLEDESFQTATNDTFHGWQVSGQSTGVMNGVKDDGTGLVLGP